MKLELQICYFLKHPYMIMKNVAAKIVWVLKGNVVIVIMFTRNLKIVRAWTSGILENEFNLER